MIRYLDLRNRSMNNRYIVEVYKKEALRPAEKSGFAFVDQKLKLKGLRILMDVTLTNPDFTIPAGWTAYIKEELLHGQAWAQKVLECDAISQPFLIVDATYVEFVAPPKEE